MSASLQLDGLKELRDALEDLPNRLAHEEFGPIVLASAEGLAAEVRSTYPTHTGNLANNVVVQKGDEARGLRARVRSKAKHAHLYEYGSVSRFTNETGAARGSMPAKRVFVPAAIRWRARMVEQTKAALRRLRVPGFDGSPEVRDS